MSKARIQKWLPLEAMLAASQMGGDVVRIFPIRRIGRYGLAILRYDHVMPPDNPRIARVGGYGGKGAASESAGSSTEEAG